DDTGHRRLRTPLTQPARGRAARVTLEATVTDVNRQTVSSSASVTVHPAAFYLAAKTVGNEYFWRGGTPQEIQVVAVQPDGHRVPDVAVHGAIVRREWHRVQRAREGLEEQVGDWVSDTVAQCNLTTASTPV